MFMQFFIKASQYWQSISSRATTGNTLDSILYHLFCIFSFIFPSNVGKEKKNTWAMTQKNGAKSCPTYVPSNVHGRTHSYPFGSGLCIFVWSFLYFHMSCPLTKPTKWPVSPVKTQISLGICPVWSVFAICMMKHWAFNYLLSTQWRLWADPGWSLSSLGEHIIFLVLSCGGSYNNTVCADCEDSCETAHELTKITTYSHSSSTSFCTFNCFSTLISLKKECNFVFIILQGASELAICILYY